MTACSFIGLSVVIPVVMRTYVWSLVSENAIAIKCGLVFLGVQFGWLVLFGQCVCSHDQLCPAVCPRSGVPTHALSVSSPRPLPPRRALRLRARPTVLAAGPTRAPAIAPLRAAPASDGEAAGGGARGGRRGRALPGTARAEGREEENKTRGQSQSWSCRRRCRLGRLELPRADDARDARAGLGVVRPGTRGSYGDRERGPRRRLTGVGPQRGGGGTEQDVRQGGQGLGRALRQPGTREVSQWAGTSGAGGGAQWPRRFRGPHRQRALRWALRWARGCGVQGVRGQSTLEGPRDLSGCARPEGAQGGARYVGALKTQRVMRDLRGREI